MKRTEVNEETAGIDSIGVSYTDGMVFKISTIPNESTCVCEIAQTGNQEEKTAGTTALLFRDLDEAKQFAERLLDAVNRAKAANSKK